jgi:DNA-binding transcriptional MerR regulator
MPKALTRRTTAAPRHSGMSHEIAKLLLEHAETFLERTEAIKSALSLGMPLREVEQYLDWLDSVRGTDKAPPKKNGRKQAPPGGSS